MEGLAADLPAKPPKNFITQTGTAKREFFFFFFGCGKIRKDKKFFFFLFAKLMKNVMSQGESEDDKRRFVV